MYRILTSEQEAREFFVPGMIIIDLETTGLDPRTDKILLAACTNNVGHTALIEADKLPILRLLDPKLHHLVGHHFKFDLHFLYQAEIDLKEFSWGDTLHAHHLLDENSPHDLDFLTQKYCDTQYKEKFWGKYKTAVEASRDDLYEYAALDALYTFQLYAKFLVQLEQEGLIPLYNQTIELAQELFRTELHGVCIDADYLTEFGIEAQRQAEVLRLTMRSNLRDALEVVELGEWAKEITKYKTDKKRLTVLKPEFNFDSGRQVQALLYEVLELPVQINPKTKNPTVDEKALEALSHHHPFIQKLIEYRGLQKVYGVYVEGTLERAVQGRIHASINVSGTKTGRLSCSDPNLQQWPRDGGVRGGIVPAPGHRLLSCDYSSLEVVIAAHYTRDRNLLRIVFEGASQHDITAESLKIPRVGAKTLNFAMQYGCSAYKIKSMLGVSTEKAEKIYAGYWETYSGVKKEMDACAKLIDTGSPIISIFGRRRRFETKDRAPWDKAYRQAFNAKIQGTGADLCNAATKEAAKVFREKGYGRVLFPIHDEILAEVRIGAEVEAAAALQRIMISQGEKKELSVPLSVSCSKPMERWEK